MHFKMLSAIILIQHKNNSCNVVVFGVFFTIIMLFKENG